ncbi:hypothetical protein JZ751_013630, partial [Albula glossodonta]
MAVWMARSDPPAMSETRVAVLPSLRQSSTTSSVSSSSGSPVSTFTLHCRGHKGVWLSEVGGPPNLNGYPDVNHLCRDVAQRQASLRPTYFEPANAVQVNCGRVRDVGGCQGHAHVVMAQHHALGLPCGARGVDQRAALIRFLARDDVIQLCISRHAWWSTAEVRARARTESRDMASQL